ncbi:MAG: hypothetical protein GXP41_08830 [Chloroflexi bacterium]|nr:hypothetical protein [Chloroflexota bacterium]
MVISKEKDHAIVWGYGRATHDTGYGVEGRAVDHEALIACCEEVLTTAENVATDAAGQPLIADDSQIGVSGAFLWSYVPAVQRRRASPDEPVSDDELERILRSLARMAQDYTETLSRRTHLRMEIVSLAAITFHLDDQWVTDPRGLFGETLHARLFAAYAPRHYLETLNLVAERLDLNVRGIISIPEALIVATTQPDGIVLKVGDTSTQVMQIEHRCPTWFDRYPVGGAMCTQTIVHEIGLLPARAEAAKRTYARGGGDESTRGKWKDALAPVCAQWQEDLIEILRRAGSTYPLPPTIAYCGGGAALHDLYAGLPRKFRETKLPFEQAPEIRPLLPRAIHGWEDRTTNSWDLGDVPIISTAVRAARAGQTTLSKRLTRLSKESSFR